MDPVSLTLSVVPVVVEAYQLVESAYDLYLKFKEFPIAFQELQIGLQIEHYRLGLWAKTVLSEHQQQRLKSSSGDLKLWKLFHSVFQKILDAFQEGDQAVNKYGERANLGQEDTLAGKLHAPQHKFNKSI